jgi:hypothetical protein
MFKEKFYAYIRFKMLKIKFKDFLKILQQEFKNMIRLQRKIQDPEGKLKF